MTIFAIASGQAGGIKFNNSTNGAPFVEAFEGEVVSLASDGFPIESVAVVAAPPGGSPVVDFETKPVTVTPAKVGRHHLRVRTSDGIDTDVSVIVCESGCVDRIADRQRSGGDSIDKRRVLRELARYDATFTGLASDLANKPLQNYGGA
jgi:hypothetical protein